MYNIYYIYLLYFLYIGDIMDIKQMLYFKTIVEEGTISKAAQHLHMAQPPLSMQLKQLETELGVQLLKRGHRKVELTDAGKLFYKRSLQILNLSELTLHEMKDAQNETIRIGITSSNSALIQQPKVQKFLHEHSQLSFQIHEGTTYEMIDLLLAHNIDFAIVRTPFDATNVQVFYLEKEPMIAIGHYDYFHKNEHTIKDLCNLPLIIHQRYLPLITDYCLNQHFNPYIKTTCDDCRTSLIWASSHQGIAIIPQSALLLNHDTTLHSMTLEDKELYTSIAFIMRKDEKISDIIQEFINRF